MSTPVSRLTAAAAATLLGCSTALAADPPATPASAALETRLAALESRLAAAERAAQSARDRGAVGASSRYMYLHNTFQDERIKALWARRGTPGMSAQYSNLGVYTNYDSIIAYHSGRPHPGRQTHLPLPHNAARRNRRGRPDRQGSLDRRGRQDPPCRRRSRPGRPRSCSKHEAEGNEVHGKKISGRAGSRCSTASTSSARTASGGSCTSAASR